MINIKFPAPETATEDGVVAVGGVLTVDYLVSAYSQGIFPWPHEGYELLWFCPWERGILDFSEFHVSKSLKKLAKKVAWKWTVDRAFVEVIKSCSETPRPGQDGTWINNEVIDAYIEMHRAGFAHSFEVWDGEELIAGIYGIFVKNVFSAESMFFRRTNASKWGFWELVNYLKKLGLTWIDVQMVTNASQSFGAQLISQKDFLTKLRLEQKKLPISWKNQ